jgi:hypothetical protein
MRIIPLLLSLSLCLVSLSSQSENNSNLVLLSIDVSERDAYLEVEYGAAFYGPSVER